MVHSASPFPIGIPKEENVVVKPAVEETLAVMRAAHKQELRGFLSPQVRLQLS